MRPMLKRFPVAAALLAAQPAFGCAVCYGASDSPMAQGMNWGIFSLLGVIGTVLAGIAGVGVFFARRAAAVAEEDSTGTTISE